MNRRGARSLSRGGFGLRILVARGVLCWIYVWVGNARRGPSRMALA